MSWPKTYRSWRRTKLPYPLRIVPSTETLPDTLGPREVLIRIHAVALNYRDVGMLEQGKYPIPVEDGGITASDCAAEVVATGSEAKNFVAGDRVAATVDSLNLTGTERSLESIALGGNGPGVLREYAIFEEDVLVKLPQHLTWEEASTLPGTGVTAWTSLNGLKDVPPNATALLQGTGGVSYTTLLVCLAAGIKPIVTSSSDEKIEKIKELSPSIDAINYRTSNDVKADVMRLTDGKGVDYVVNNVGISSIPDDLDVIRKNGTIALVGFLGGFQGSLSAEALITMITKACRLQGILCGSRVDFENLNAFLEEKKVRLDSSIDRSFTFDDAPVAFEYLVSGKHTGKVVIKL